MTGQYKHPELGWQPIATVTGGEGGTPGSGPDHPGHVAGRALLPTGTTTANSSVTIANSQIIYVPFDSPAGETIARIGTKYGSGGDTGIRAAIYAGTAAGPGAMLGSPVDLPIVSWASVTAAFTTPVEVPAGPFWVGITTTVASIQISGVNVAYSPRSAGIPLRDLGNNPLQNLLTNDRGALVENTSGGQLPATATPSGVTNGAAGLTPWVFLITG